MQHAVHVILQLQTCIRRYSCGSQLEWDRRLQRDLHKSEDACTDISCVWSSALKPQGSPADAWAPAWDLSKGKWSQRAMYLREALPQERAPRFCALGDLFLAAPLSPRSCKHSFQA